MALYRETNLGPSKSAAPPRVKNQSASKKQTKKPSELLEERMKGKGKSRSLSESLSEVSMMMPAGEGMMGKALKAGLGGAAAGATIGEALSKLHQEKIQRGQKQKPRTVSETAMSGGEYDRKRKSRERGRPKGGRSESAYS